MGIGISGKEGSEGQNHKEESEGGRGTGKGSGARKLTAILGYLCRGPSSQLRNCWWGWSVYLARAGGPKKVSHGPLLTFLATLQYSVNICTLGEGGKAVRDRAGKKRKENPKQTAKTPSINHLR